MAGVYHTAACDSNVEKVDCPLYSPSRRLPLVANPKGNRERFSRIDMKRDLSWRNYTSPDLTANLDLDPVIASTLFALAAFFADSIFTVASPNLLAACAHEGHTSILSRTTPPSSVVT